MIIGTRNIKIRNATGHIDVPINVFAPERRGTDYICRFEINWPKEKIEQWGTGGDGIEAVFHAFRMIGALLYASDYHRQGRLHWLEPGAGFGFPVTKNMRDILEGDDKRYL
jgi:hypothetical protein